MCGIAGIAGKWRQSYSESLQRMVKSLHHRGPDASGIKVFSECGLAHARLSIVDLKTGHQPMISCDGKSAISFNGEIYGYKDLKKNFIDYPFKSDSDTELILAAYSKKGSVLLDDLPGMFAFAIWDETKKKLFCARDRFGEKPFYYFLTQDNSIVFASEIKALIVSGLVKPEIDLSSISHYFKHLYVHPDKTIYTNIRVLPPGCFLEFSDGSLRVDRYWNLPEPAYKNLTETDAVEEFKFLLERSVKNQLVADVPVGVFLSGGFDSTTITTIASKFSRNLKTFSFGFGENINELPIAEATSRKCNTSHQILTAGNYKISELIVKQGNFFDEPLGDSSTIPTFLISEAAAKECKVVLGGDGADELLGGYDWYRILHSAQSQDQFSASNYWLDKIIAYLTRRLMPRRASLFSLRAQGQRLKRDFNNEQEILSSLNSYFSDSELEALGVDSCPLEITPSHGTDLVDKRMRMDICNYLPGNILAKIDRTSMACSLELRAPFLDHKLAEFCISLPSRLKVSRSKGKLLLRKAYEDQWVEEVLKGKKQGFGAPVCEWLKMDDVRQLKSDLFSSPGAKIYSYIDRKTAKEILHKNDYRTWSIMTLGVWLECQRN